MEKADQRRFLYQLQDRVLEMVFAEENIFYLTGGTCLSRFYWAKRHSDDLDFFAEGSRRFALAARRVMRRLEEAFEVSAEIESKDFYRFRLNNLLQVDFVNDHSPRYGKVVETAEGYLVDNPENILANKLTAILGRDDPKDVFDVYLIWRFRSFSWKDILRAAREKAAFEDSDLIVRLETFPSKLLERVDVLDPVFLNDFDRDRRKLIDEIQKHAYHKHRRDSAITP